MGCGVCGTVVVDTADRCITCGEDIGFPNVRAATREAAQLQARYDTAIARAKDRGCLDVALALEKEITDSSRAAINVDLDFLSFFLSKGSNLFGNYEAGVAGEVRIAASFQDDALRRVVGGTLFGAYASKVRYAALWVGGPGLVSYGEYVIVLKNVAVAARTSLLDENSYDFFKKHGFQGSEVFGHRSTWGTRAKLAVIKLEPQLEAGNDFANLLISSTGDRASDQFIEAHIFGPFGLNAIERIVCTSAASSKGERALRAIARERVEAMGAQWIE